MEKKSIGKKSAMTSQHPATTSSIQSETPVKLDAASASSALLSTLCKVQTQSEVKEPKEAKKLDEGSSSFQSPSSKIIEDKMKVPSPSTESNVLISKDSDNKDSK